MNDQPPIGRLLKATVFFDTTVPRHFGVINECAVLRSAFPRALITTGVELELTNARGPVAKLGGDLGPLLDDPCWAGVEELVDAQILDVEQLRLGLGANRPEDLLFKETKDLGEFETVVASQAKGGFPIVMEDGKGARVAWRVRTGYAAVRSEQEGTGVAAVERRGKVDQDRRDLVRVVGLALVTATVQGLDVANFGSGQAWPLGFLLAVLVCGVVGGLISANRWHVLAVCAGGAAGVIVAGVASDHGPLSPGELAAYLVLPASLDAGLLGLVGGPAHLVLRRVRAPLARLAAAGVLLVAIAASWVAFFGYLMASPAQIAGYRILDPQTIVVTAAGIPHGWTRVTAVAETESAVRIDASSSAWMWGPGTADLQNVELSVQLARPLDGRAVLNSAGQPVPLSELP